MIIIDGTQGEGGGQVLRSSLTLSLATGKSFRITRIRAGRARPGLLHQHLAAVNAARDIGRADVSGNRIGSQELTFVPADIAPGRYHFAVGTAGSATLVLQAVLPALLAAGGPSALTLEGGTHNPFAPPFEFLAQAFLPVLRRMGAKVTATLERPGFYPAGGGRFAVEIAPVARLQRVDIIERGAIRACTAQAIVARLARSIAERELNIVKHRLRWKPSGLRIEECHSSPGPGNALTLVIESEGITEVFAGFGRKGVRAEEVADRAVDEVQTYLNAGVPVGPHLADQLLVPLVLAGGGRFRTLAPTRHTRTNIKVLRTFVDAAVHVREVGESVWEIEVQPDQVRYPSVGHPRSRGGG